MELLYRGAPITCAAGKLGIANTPSLQLSLDQAEHGGELGKQQHPTSPINQGLEHLQQGAEFAGIIGIQPGRWVL